MFVASDIDPVACYELMLSKLNKKRDDLWQRPKKNLVNGNAEEWYENAPIGRDMLNDFMKHLSVNAELSKMYTNHCIRATVVTELDKKGFEARDIMATTGHRSESSIKSYASKCPETKRRAMSEALATPFIEPQEKKPKIVAETISKPPEDPSINEGAASPEGTESLEFPEIDIPENQLLAILTQIEKENEEIEKKAPEEKQNPPTDDKPKENKVLQVSNVSNVSNRNQMFPGMYFPHSNVTINYNIYGQIDKK